MTEDSKSVLMILTSHDKLGQTGHRTGFWYEELAAPYYTFQEAGLKPAIASPKGGRPPIDPASATPEFKTPHVERFGGDDTAQSALSTSHELGHIDGLAGFAGLFLVGGHGTMWDFPGSSALSRLLGQAHATGVPIGAVCHGVVGLSSLNGGANHPLVDGRRMTGFTNAEENAVGLTEVVPFLLEDRMKELGAAFETSDPFSPHIVIDGALVTGQNPASSEKTALALVDLIGR